MVQIENVDLTMEQEGGYYTDDNFGAKLTFDVAFSSAEQQPGDSYQAIGGLVEVDGPLDRFEPEQNQYYTLEGPIHVTTLEQHVEGQRDNNLGVLGEARVEASMGRESFEYTERLGDVLGLYGDDKFVIASRGDLDEGVLDTDEDQFSSGHTVSSEFRGMVWVTKGGEVIARSLGDAEQVEFLLHIR